MLGLEREGGVVSCGAWERAKQLMELARIKLENSRGEQRRRGKLRNSGDWEESGGSGGGRSQAGQLGNWAADGEDQRAEARSWEKPGESGEARRQRRGARGQKRAA